MRVFVTGNRDKTVKELGARAVFQRRLLLPAETGFREKLEPSGRFATIPRDERSHPDRDPNAGCTSTK